MIDLTQTFADAGVEATFHAVDMSNGNEVAHGADELSITASVFKLPVLIELCRQVSVGELDGATPVQVPAADRAPGPNGLSVMQDPMTMSLRDLAWQMMGISDNAATDVVCAHVCIDKVQALMIELGLKDTFIGGDCRDLFATMTEDIELQSLEQIAEVTWELLAKLRANDPTQCLQRTTPRDITRLLQLIWDDEAAPADACAEARRILGLQVWPHRLASGFPEDDVKTSGKTGTLPTLRNEVGVVEYPDGGRYAVACFTRANTLAQKNPAADAVIGRAARLAVDALRAKA